MKKRKKEAIEEKLDSEEQKESEKQKESKESEKQKESKESEKQKESGKLTDTKESESDEDSADKNNTSIIKKPPVGKIKEDPTKKGIPVIIKKSLTTLLKAAQRAVNKQDTKKLEVLSERAIHDAMIYQDEDSLSMAVILFALSKLLKRETAVIESTEDLRNYLASAQFSLDQGDPAEYRDKIKKTTEFISAIDKQFKIYVEKVIEKAQIKKGSSLYERGISVAKAASLLGVSQWELMSYIGKTKIHDRVEDKIRVGERIRIARALFK